jgi:hypothetical protein
MKPKTNFFQNQFVTFSDENGSQKIGLVIYIIIKNYAPKTQNPIGENSPNLVTLVTAVKSWWGTEERFFKMDICTSFHLPNTCV